MSDTDPGIGPDPQLPPDDAATHDAASPDTPTRARRLPPAAGKGLVPADSIVIQQRIATIARALVDGLGRAAIFQAVQKAQLKEAADRTKAKIQGLAGTELAHAVPFVWGDTPTPERTIEYYIHRAKKLLGEEGRTTVIKHRDYVLALTLARYNETFQAAFAAGRYSVCRMILRDLVELFSLKEAVKTLLLADARAQSDAENAGRADNLGTDQGRVSALTGILSRVDPSNPALARFAQIISAVPLKADDAPAPKGNGKHAPNGGKKL